MRNNGSKQRCSLNKRTVALFGMSGVRGKYTIQLSGTDFHSLRTGDPARLAIYARKLPNTPVLTFRIIRHPSYVCTNLCQFYFNAVILEGYKIDGRDFR